MSLSANREVGRYVDQELREYGVTGGGHIYKGGLVGLASDGYARAFSAGDLFLGLSYEEADNTSGADGAKRVRVFTIGDFELSIGGLAITDIGAPVYASDDGTVTLDPGNASYVGYVVDFVSSGKGIVRLESGNLIRGRSYLGFGEVDCEQGATPQTVVLVPPSVNKNGMVLRRAYAVVTEQFVGSTQDQGIVTLQDSDGSSINVTFTPSDGGADALNDVIAAGGSAKAMATASTGDAGAVLAAGKGLKAVVTQSTTGTSKAGKLEIVVEAITR